MQQLHGTPDQMIEALQNIIRMQENMEKKLREKVDPLHERVRELTPKLRPFWEAEIMDRELFHGSSTFYLEHIQAHGLGRKYPFEKELEHIIRFYQKFQKYKTSPYFDWFIDRFLAQKANLSFTFSKEVALGEYATGERRGGEWLKSINSFSFSLSQAIAKKEVSLSHDDVKEFEFLKRFTSLASQHKGMLISVKCSCPDLEGESVATNFALGCYDTFIRNIVEFYHDQDAEQIIHGVRKILLWPDNEIVIRKPIKYENLRIQLFD